MWDPLYYCNVCQVVEMLLGVGLEWMCDEGREVQGRVGGLYLLYAVYFVQPCDPKVHVSCV